MAKGRRVPRWLARRMYFRRIERWAKLDRKGRSATASDSAAAPLPSNVVPFPTRPTRPGRSDFGDLRGVGIA
jgi:hypothetical protein